MDSESYIQVGDEIAVVYASTLDSFSGKVLEVGAGEYGRRLIIIQKAGTDFLADGAVGVPESVASMSVRRGDSWVGLPLPLLFEDATEKAKRNEVNQRKRIEKAVPLFAEQIETSPVSAERWVEQSRTGGEERLMREHEQAMEANTLRAWVQAHVSGSDFGELCLRRERYPKDALYGVTYWKKHIKHIEDTGTAEIFVAPPSLRESMKIDWLRYGAILTWLTAPDGPRAVKVLWVGPTLVCCRLIGEPIVDFDPRVYPHQTVWLLLSDVEAPAEVLTCS